MSTMNKKPTSARTQSAVLIGIVVAGVLSATSFVPLAGEVLVVVGVALGWWLVAGFWRSVLFGALAGVTAGVLVLGVGLRVAMRVVAMMDPSRTPELTFEGTMFILLGLGGMFGGIVGIFAHLARRGLGIRSAVIAAFLPAAGAMSILFVDDEIRRELFKLGGGALVNIPMFGVVAFLYGLTAVTMSGAFERRSAAKRDVTKPVEMRA